VFGREGAKNYDECHCKVGKAVQQNTPPKPKMVPVGCSRPFLKLIISKTGSVLIFSKSKSAMTMTTRYLQHKHYEELELDTKKLYIGANNEDYSNI
jgi:hypothetical protein